MNNEYKISILISGLEERYKSIHVIRNRVHTTSIWLLWILLWTSWWIVKTNIIFNCYEKAYFIVLVFLAWLFILFFYYFDLEKGFASQRKIAWKLEKELWFYDKGNLIYPKSWETWWKWNFFRNNYILIWFWFITLLGAIFIFI